MSFQEAKAHFSVSEDHSTLFSHVNHRSFPIGQFSTPSLAELREELCVLLKESDATEFFHVPSLEFRHIAVADALSLHAQHPNAIIQAASQFNCLEFPNPRITPEDGIEQYSSDGTQGPACALACAAGTLYRNYFAQTGDNQINNLRDLELALDNDNQHFFEVRNGYTFSSSADRLLALNEHLVGFSSAERDHLRGLIRVGRHENVGVTFLSRFIEPPAYALPLNVTQVYCSALSISYSQHPTPCLWSSLARLVLEACYESTLLIAAIALLKDMQTDSRGRHREVYLSFIGGGVFGNDMSWITAAIARSLQKISCLTTSDGKRREIREGQRQRQGLLNVRICHYRKINPSVVDMFERTTAALFGAEQGHQSQEEEKREGESTISQEEVPKGEEESQQQWPSSTKGMWVGGSGEK